MGNVQRDWVVEADDKLVVGSDEALQSIVDRLPVTALIKVVDAATALDVSPSQVHNWIDSGSFQCLVIGVGDGRKHRRIIRSSFVEFLRKSLV